MIFKRGDPINMLFMSTSELFGEVFFPITVLPSWLQTVSHLLPMTYSLNGMRHALHQGYTLRELAPYVGTLVLFSAILLPASLQVCGQEGEDGGDAGALLIEKISGLEF